MNAGIDYSLGRSNIDKSNGIRYGVISQHTVGERWYDAAEGDYGEATCGHCGNKAVEYSDEKHGEYLSSSDIGGYRSCADYACETCKVYFDSESAFPDEALGWSYQDSEYTLTDCLDSDIFVLKSPFYTFAQFCSPCVPGAGNLNNPCDDGPKTYCLGHDWFEEGEAPYKVFRVSDDAEVLPEEETC